MSHLRASGVHVDYSEPLRIATESEGLPTRLIYDVNETLARAFRHEENWARSVVRGLINSHLVGQRDIPEALVKDAFPNRPPGSHYRVVYLTAKGAAKLKDCNDAVNDSFERIASKVFRHLWLVNFLGKFDKTADRLVEAIRKELKEFDPPSPSN